MTREPKVKFIAGERPESSCSGFQRTETAA